MTSSVTTAGVRYRLLARQLFRFFWASLAGLAIDVGLFTVLAAIGAHIWLANLVSASTAVILMYALVTRYTFGRRFTTATFVLFVLWYVLSIPAFSALVQVGVSAFELQPIASKIASLPVSFIANFLFARVLFGLIDRRSQRTTPQGAGAAS